VIVANSVEDIGLHIFSRPYFINGRAVVMVVVRLSVCLSARPFVCYGCTVAKRCKIGPRLLLITNRKSHTGIGFQTACKSSTLKVTDY